MRGAATGIPNFATSSAQPDHKSSTKPIAIPAHVATPLFAKTVSPTRIMHFLEACRLSAASDAGESQVRPGRPAHQFKFAPVIPAFQTLKQTEYCFQ
jgi:hypothetical protein